MDEFIRYKITFFKFQQLANTGKLKFLDESESVRAEAERLKSKHGVDIIIVLSHCGLETDRLIAKTAGPLIDVIVGGHSHTFLYSGQNPLGPDTPKDKYPVEIIQDNGHKVLIVQASCYTKYVGDITVYFDRAGEVVRYEGKPIFLAHHIIQGVYVYVPFFYMEWVSLQLINFRSRNC